MEQTALVLLRRQSKDGSRLAGSKPDEHGWDQVGSE